jgi:2-polyprenyl-6-methoxyphenol hydroxylase-like FAD-dependent oxidoreductase
MKIVISGSGIAGAAAALFLARKGHEVLVVERAPSFQKRGYAITLKNFGLKLMTELGLHDEIERHSLHLDELRLYQQDGRLLQVYPHEITDRITHGQVLLYRSELHALLYEATRTANMPTRFGAEIRAVEQGAHRVTIHLEDGGVEKADLLVVAEGVRSATRKLIFGDEGVRLFDVAYAAATVKLDHGLDPRAVHGYFGEGQNIALMPAGANDLLVQCYWRVSANPSLSGATPRDRVLATFRSFAPVVKTVLDGIGPNGDVFCDSISMIALPSLHRGRTVLLGDAGYCPTFLSGMGASLGLLGAKVLSVSLPQDGAPVESALEQYTATMRPVVDHFQANALHNVDNALPVGHLKNVIRSWFVQLMPPPLFACHFRHQFEVEDTLLRDFV